MQDFCKLTAAEMINKIRNREISARDLIKSHLERIEKIEPKVLAWAYLDKNSALKKAEEIDNKIKNNELGKLSGIPIGVKDVFNTFDMPNEMGSVIWKDYTPGNDARVIYMIREEGAVIPGKTVTAEFAVHAEGKTLNPHNSEFSPGTSSSGSAVAVATCMVPLALGTQTGGSIIKPASYNGVYGMKPSFGLIPRTGVLKTTDTLDTIGFFSRSVEDLKLMLDITRVSGDDYPLIKEHLENESRQKSRNIWKVALVKSHLWKYAEDYAKDALLNFVDKLKENKNIVINEVNLPEGFENVYDVHTLIYDKTLAYYFNKEYSDNINKLSSIIKEIIARGNKISLDDYKIALKKQIDLSLKLDKLFENYDIILTLSTSSHAPKKHRSENLDTSWIWTFCGVPSINLPVFKSPNNLPFGAQIVARKYNDYLLLNFAEFLRKNNYVKDGTFPKIPF
jgi:Asp-tRNA(Asn)/Glu-tRNA(Gln) amidotransferase A subunit family amidase